MYGTRVRVTHNRRLELRAVATRAKTHVENHLEAVMAAVKRTTTVTLG
jgi:hypothetical protein